MTKTEKFFIDKFGSQMTKWPNAWGWAKSLGFPTFLPTAATGTWAGSWMRSRRARILIGCPYIGCKALTFCATLSAPHIVAGISTF